MKSKHIVILAIVFALLAFVNIVQKLHSTKKTTGEVRHEEWHPFIPPEKAASILFSREGFPALELKKENETWKVASLGNVDADKSKINSFINQLNQIKAELRAEGENLYERFEITGQKVFRIQIEDASGTAMVDFLMGAKRSGSGVFIRLAGSPKIYFTTDDIPALFGLFGNLEQAGPQPLFFTDLKLVLENFEQIQRFEVAELRDEKKIPLAALERASVAPGAPWNFLSGTWKFPVDAGKVENYLNRVAGTFAENIETNVPEFKPSLEILLHNEQGQILHLEFSKSGTEWLVKREGSPAYFQISPLVFNDLKTEDAVFVADNPLELNIDESFTVELIHDGKTEKFSKASNGWPSAAAILDAAMKLQFTGIEHGIQAKDLSALPPTHILRVIRPEAETVEIRFYVTDPKLTEIKSVISGQTLVFKVSRAFFESIFVPAAIGERETGNG